MSELTDAQLDNVQGDIWSRGFPKRYEIYYFFTIKDPTDFVGCLKTLAKAKPPLISTLKKVHNDREHIDKKMDEAKKARLEEPNEDIANALIAFTFAGLEALQTAHRENQSLDLAYVQSTDKAFSDGMAHDGKLSDPAKSTWEPLFRSAGGIHGLLKVAGNKKETAEPRLNSILTVFGAHMKGITDDSSAIIDNSRIDGWTRPGKLRGHEHFGFQDGISQPLMKGVDKIDQSSSTPNDGFSMITNPSILIVGKNTQVEGEKTRPEWMNNGSFLVFRKLEQDVKGFEKLTGDYAKFGYASQQQMGAKLMGRWPSGYPISMSSSTAKEDPGTDKEINDFSFGNSHACPMFAHIRKTNPREIFDNNSKDLRGSRTKIIRNGIPYGTEASKKDGTKRGLLFACYQGHIEDGFQHMQADWSNNPGFFQSDVGVDPISGQVPQIDEAGKKVNGQLVAHIPSEDMKTSTTDNTKISPTPITFKQLVTMKGGEYFFAPSILALEKALGNIDFKGDPF